ncbi:MAG: amino acid permease [Burkholderiaceae bacterium]|jgi:amino acid transporter|nr:amino acid permease [Burkholderiaceae bacterium]MEB2318931.1 amino acid permease [Pseudomonadota bacterium]
MSASPDPAKASRRAAAQSAQPRSVLSLHHAVAIIVGIVIGAGIFKAPAMVASFAGSPAWMFGAWILGGVVSIIGALVYAELATACPHAGGDYHFLDRAYGRTVSFLFAWARFSVIATGSIALLAFVFGDYMQELLPLGENGPFWYAAASIVALTWVNLRGARAGANTQGWLTLFEVSGLLLVFIAGLWLFLGGDPVPAGDPAPAGAPAAGAFGMAMVFVLLTFGGWNEAAYISAELENARRNMLRSLLVSITLITGLYLLVNWAYWQGLGIDGMAASSAIAADLLATAFGPTGAVLIALMVAVAALTSINATMIVGARTSFALGRDWPQLARLGEWDAERSTPTVALLAQCVASLALVAAGRIVGGGFTAMVEFTAPVFWLFFLLAGASLIVLRLREPDLERPFRVPFYPLTPLVFCAVCAFMLWSSLSYVRSQELGGFNAAWIGVAVLGIGVVLLLILRLTAATRSAVQRSAQ